MLMCSHQAHRHPGQIMLLLHSTSSARLPSIMSEGLSDACLTSCEESADYYAEEAVEENGGEPVILEVEVSPSMKDNFRADYPSFEAPLTWIWRAWSDSEEEFHEMLSGTSEISWPDGEHDWKTSLRVVRAVRYVGTIPPERIRVRE